MATAVEPALLTFLIADVRGYTRFTLEHGDEAAARLATVFAQVATELIEPAGGRVVELRGDEVLAVFPSARQALRAGVELQSKLSEVCQDDLPLRAGVGIDAGEAVPVDGGYSGAALNLAARLCSLAAPGEVLASETVTNLARKMDGLSYLERGETELKGFTSRVMVMEVVAEQRATKPALKEDGVEEQHLPIGGFLGALPANPIVARDKEMASVRGAIDAVRAGQGRLLLLTGEPGVGKTRLAQEITLHVRNQGFLVGTGRCYEPEGSVPYYPFREALGMFYDSVPTSMKAEVPRKWGRVLRLLPRDLGEVAEPEQSGGNEEQQRLFYAVSGFVEALSVVQPVALLLDDLHWADESSLKLLQYLTRHARTSPVLLLGTYRDVDVGRQQPLEKALRDLNREGLMEEIAVRRLDQEGTAALTAATFGETDVSGEFADLLYRHTEGNPFFTHEVLRTLVDRGDVYQENGRWERRKVDEIEVPKSVRSTVGERVSRLDEEAQEVLAEASVLGQTFEFDDLQGLSERPEREIEEVLEAAEEAGLVRLQKGDAYAFAHALIQQVLYGEMSPRRRRRLHLRAGEALEGGTHREDRVAELAWHFLQGDDAAKALPYALEAGERSEELFAYAEAERHYRTALELATELDNRACRAQALLKLGHVMGEQGKDFDEAVRHLKEADRIFGELDNLDGQQRAIAWAAELTAVRHVNDEEVEARVANLLATSEPSEGLVLLYNHRARNAFAGGRYQESVEMATRVGEMARAIGSDWLLAEGELRRGTSWGYVNPTLERRDEAIEILRAAVKLAEKSGNISVLATGLNNLANGYMDRGDLQRNLEYRRQALEVNQKVGGAIGLIFAYAMVGQALAMLGRLNEAAQFAEEAVRRARKMDPVWHSAYALFELGRLRMLQGDGKSAEALLHEGLTIVEAHQDRQGANLYRSFAGELALLREEPWNALSVYEGVEHNHVMGWALWPLATALLGIGDMQAALPLIDRMVEPNQVIEAEGLRLRAVANANRGDAEAAHADFDHALRVARSQGYRLEEGRVLHEQGVVLAAHGDIDEARQRLREALQLFREIGAHAYADRTERTLRELLRSTSTS